MPTIFVFLGLRFFFYSNENNGPVHVHVKSGNGEAKFWLTPEVKCDSNFGFPESQPSHSDIFSPQDDCKEG